MSLQPGTTLGPYEVIEPIGIGGMGEVYRARDKKLKRDVALKVLPEAFVNDPERLARFRREAEVLASLNHPNIAQIYGLEDSGDTTAIVLELVEGETLAERIARGPIPLDEALDIARQIIDALQAAHALGIIHRDLKPANIKLTHDGVVKVLDFGLAKALISNDGADPELSQSPTLTRGTAMGTILGTAAYMSPEQARAKPVDARTDVWAFGAVLYEMLAGERAFKGEDVSDTLVAVFRDDPDWTKLPDDIPTRIPQAMRVCLKKDAKERVRDIAAVRLALDGAFETQGPAARPVESSRWTPAPTALVVVLAGLVVGLGVWVMTHRSTDARAVSRTSIVLPKTQRPSNMGRRGIAVSPTGTHIAYTANQQLYVRAMDEVDAKPLRGADGSEATLPFFSPDGQWIGFYSRRDQKLAKIATSDGAAVTLCSPGGRPNGASWSRDGTIVFGLAGRGVLQVSEDGGEPEVLVAVDPERGELVQSPQILPDGRTVLFTLASNSWTQSQIVAQSLDTGDRRVLVENASDGRYLTTGHLVYAADGNLLAVAFDPERLEVQGGPVPVVESVRRANVSVARHFDISRDGMLVYLPARDTNALRTLVWVDRDGREEPIAAEPRHYAYARISPDGTKAVLYLDDEERDLWIWDFERETLTRLTFDPELDARATWTPDGEHVVFTSLRDGAYNLYRKAVDGTGEVERLFESPTRQFPQTFTAEGAGLMIMETLGDNQSTRLSLLTFGDDIAVAPLLDTGFPIFNAGLSPDRRWLVYHSDVSGRNEVYVRTFPNVDTGRWQISTDYGRNPLWGPDGTELFFWAEDKALMRVPIDTDPTFRPGTAERLVEPGPYFSNPRTRPFDISPDGKRFLMVKEDSARDADDPYAGLTQFIVVHNWFEELKALVPVD